MAFTNVEATLKQRRDKVVSTLFQPWTLTLHQRSATFKIRLRILFIFNVGSTLFQRWSTTLKERWSDVEMLAVLFSRVFFANWFSTMFCIFICSFPDIYFFLINWNLFRFCNRFLTFSNHSCSFTYGFCSLLLVYQSFLLVSTRLPFTSRLYSFMSRSTNFYSFTQGSTSFIKLGLESRFRSLASHFLQHFKLKREKKRYERLIFGVYSPQDGLQHALR